MAEKIVNCCCTPICIFLLEVITDAHDSGYVEKKIWSYSLLSLDSMMIETLWLFDGVFFLNKMQFILNHEDFVVVFFFLKENWCGMLVHLRSVGFLKEKKIVNNPFASFTEETVSYR